MSEKYVGYPTPELQKLILLFVEKGASFNFYPKDEGTEKEEPHMNNIPFFRALIYGGVGMMPQLIAMGADATATGCYGSILHLCWGKDWLDNKKGLAIRQTVACKALIDRGADVNSRNYKGRTALFHANAGVIKLLLENGADIHTQDYEGFTPLHFPLDGEAVETYISSGIPVSTMGGCGSSPLMCVARTHQFVRMRLWLDLLSWEQIHLLLAPIGQHCFMLKVQ